MEIAVGYLYARAVRRANVADPAGTEADRTVDAVLEELHDLVGRKLGEAPALRTLAGEVEAGRDVPSEDAWGLAMEALEEAAAQDPAFGEELDRVVEQLQFLFIGSRNNLAHERGRRGRGGGRHRLRCVGGRYGADARRGPPRDPHRPDRPRAPAGAGAGLVTRARVLRTSCSAAW
ncbi:hypothetical protein GXW82_10600 [Streptacidiphilus sp. 4-A2]|nr:hypothetical protein [Streptacidiphilus sp. 4-A2]